jgi:glycosyltransferase involved in cell wall biosynthesis
MSRIHNVCGFSHLFLKRNAKSPLGCPTGTGFGLPVGGGTIKRMRVVHWAPGFLAGGAVANSVVGLAEAQARSGADVIIAAAEVDKLHVYGEPTLELSTIARWKPTWVITRFGLQLRGLGASNRRKLACLNPDVVHIHGEFNPDNCWPPYLFPCPLVVSPHGAFNPVVLTSGQRHMKRAYINVAQRLLYRRSTFHALSPLEAKHIAAAVRGSRIYCVPQGPGSPIDPTSPPRPRHTESAVVEFVTICRLDVFTKGLDLLLEAFARTVAARPCRAALKLIGPDSRGGRATLEEQARRLEVADRVCFTGVVAASEIERHLANASAYIQASRHEGLSLSVTEALLAGKPTIMTSANGASAYAEVVSLPHVSVVEPDVKQLTAAMVDFIDHIAELEEAAVKTRHGLSQFFSWDRVARAHLHEYAELLQDAHRT